ncbi:hypothetical protein ANN_06315 [Periplaneta americana]|uniref:BED-type domain-containing protein n=1 Tax=Periplaneta americana TaxID=6978 RepID=A0ABQ8TD79_PERAM|nr:hypothetical protein ANN_06315 [Periplaneta americana]
MSVPRLDIDISRSPEVPKIYGKSFSLFHIIRKDDIKRASSQVKRDSNVIIVFSEVVLQELWKVITRQELRLDAYVTLTQQLTFQLPSEIKEEMLLYVARVRDENDRSDLQNCSSLERLPSYPFYPTHLFYQCGHSVLIALGYNNIHPSGGRYTIRVLQSEENWNLAKSKPMKKCYFQRKWDYDYFVVEKDERIACLLCHIQFISTRHFNIKRHFNKDHIKNYGIENFRNTSLNRFSLPCMEPYPNIQMLALIARRSAISFAMNQWSIQIRIQVVEAFIRLNNIIAVQRFFRQGHRYQRIPDRRTVYCAMGPVLEGTLKSGKQQIVSYVRAISVAKLRNSHELLFSVNIRI